jgi:hypothetical protein
MNENLRSKNGSLMYRQIESVNVPESDRRKFLELAGTAELLVNGVVWTARRIGELVGFLTLKPSAKH